tara:strand:+ start:212 stop:490 length:279 start_codon:yes stop_codon:yes gene_type:complete
MMDNFEKHWLRQYVKQEINQGHDMKTTVKRISELMTTICEGLAKKIGQKIKCAECGRKLKLNWHWRMDGFHRPICNECGDAIAEKGGIIIGI